MGEFVWAGQTYRGTHQPLVEREVYDRVQAVIDGRYRGTRDNIRADLFSFVGLIRCGHCGCALSAQIQKEKYIYYHCTGAKGRCDMPYVREEVIDKQFAAALATLRIPDELRAQLTKGLRESHEQIVAHHADAVLRLEAECARLQRRLDTMYVDKLEGVISEDAYRRHAQAWNEEIATHRKAIIRHDEAKRTYIEEAIELVDLAQELPDLYPDQEPAGKKEMLREVVSNSYWWAGELTVEFRKPFDFLREIHAAHKDEPPAGPGSDGGAFCMVAGTGFEPATFGL
ncbi:MAG: recombinase zinc beta ribbon domain-containing protein [Alphaproteobacteria bacterium]|nr:recombinase zinc beta ribbon domain-containing protein [Alphaproteobacteria bacterium]